jgi:hypothetical protein
MMPAHASKAQKGSRGQKQNQSEHHGAMLKVFPLLASAYVEHTAEAEGALLSVPARSHARRTLHRPRAPRRAPRRPTPWSAPPTARPSKAACVRRPASLSPRLPPRPAPPRRRRITHAPGVHLSAPIADFYIVIAECAVFQVPSECDCRFGRLRDL